MPQVVTITPQGGISGLQRKTGKGLDLRRFGHAKIERVSEVQWYEENQRWRVQIISGPMTGHTLTTGMVALVKVLDQIEGSTVCHYRGFEILEFDDYDDAVAAEVRYLDALRVQGVF